jgi:hypothetical protein
MSKLAEIEIKGERRIVTPGFIVEMMNAVQMQDISINKITMNAYEYADLRKFGRDVMDIVTDYKLMAIGYMSTIFGIPIYCKKHHRNATFTLDLTDSTCKQLVRKYCFQIWHEPTLTDSDCECDTCVVHEIMIS